MNSESVKAPWHFWVIGVVSLLWNSFGAFDYFMTKTRGDAYLQAAGMSPEQMAWLHAMPAWMTAVWAIGVWGALLGSVLLLLRRKLAFPVFCVSLAAFLVSLIDQLVKPMPGASGSNYIIQAVILAGCLFLPWYTRRADKKGLLR